MYEFTCGKTSLSPYQEEHVEPVEQPFAELSKAVQIRHRWFQTDHDDEIKLPQATRPTGEKKCLKKYKQWPWNFPLKSQMLCITVKSVPIQSADYTVNPRAQLRAV